MFEEETAMSTCNLSETVHNKWLKATGNRMVDLYSATMNDYNRAALQSTRYYLFLKGGQSRIEPRTSVLKLRFVSRSGNPSRMENWWMRFLVMHD